MTNHVLLDNVSHKNLRVKPTFRPGHGYDSNIARVFPDELLVLQNEYPLFLFKNRETGHFEPVALFGFSDRENLYLHEGRWDADYLPHSVERQPLLIGFQEQTVDGVPTQEPVVHIDLDHPSVSESEGMPLFLPHGGESEWLERMTSILMAIHEGHKAIPPFSQTLVGMELIESVSLDLKFEDGSSQLLKGLHTIDETRLAALNGAALESLHKDGFLHAIYMMLASQPNLEKLIQRKNRALMAAAS
ncbi:MAG: SapC family protein [Wenzhouxiangellaceae bacterium]|nr:SapC family protein [Wenzhouxiangellaceae bacterium]MBS3745868.1 SapC family protein [Wenzhouxiangellaceae bacterium]MBS3823923.1 SapC family protein [Wenzhouxiangellaceae bacterium]